MTAPASRLVLNCHSANVIFDQVSIWSEAHAEDTVTLQGALDTRKRDVTVELVCATYKGKAESGSPIAIDVENIEVQ